MRRYWLMMILGLSLVGCGGMPSRPDVVLEKSARIGVLVDIGTHPHQTYIGITVLDTFRKVYPYSWELKSLSKKLFVEKIENAGFEAVDLEALGYQPNQLRYLVVRKGETWAFNPDRITTAKKLVNDNHLQAILLVKETAVAVDNYRNNLGGTNYISVNGSGLYSTLAWGGVKYKAIAGVTVTLLSLNPPVDLSHYTPLLDDDQYYIRNVELDRSLYPTDRKNVTPEEFEKILPKVLVCMGGLADAAVCAVSAENKYECYNHILDNVRTAGPKTEK